MDETTTIAGIKIYNGPLTSLLSVVKRELNGRYPKSILTVNPEIVVQAQEDTKLREILNKAWVGIPDGVGILWAAKMQKKFISERITGVRLTQELLDFANKDKLTIGVIGGTEQASIKYREYLKRHVTNSWSLPGPWLEIINYNEMKNELNDWFDTSDGKEFSEKLKKTTILFVAMGAPKQEYFIHYVLSNNLVPKNIVALAIGGTFDELSGIVPKTPDWVGNAGMKWFHRLLSEPWRFKRQKRLLKFIRLVTTENS